ncbi:unnamed protein product, partial [Ectocarpus sp. 8 AP-2014]
LVSGGLPKVKFLVMAISVDEINCSVNRSRTDNNKQEGLQKLETGGRGRDKRDSHWRREEKGWRHRQTESLRYSTADSTLQRSTPPAGLTAASALLFDGGN